MTNRRDFLYGLGASLGGVAFTAMLEEQARAASAANPLAKKPGHLPARAKACIFLMMEGGPSHIDTFDPKPRLADLHLKEFNRSDKTQSAMSSGKRYFVQSPFKFRKAGRSGADIGENWEALAGVVDDLGADTRQRGHRGAGLSGNRRVVPVPGDRADREAGNGALVLAQRDRLLDEGAVGLGGTRRDRRERGGGEWGRTRRDRLHRAGLGLGDHDTGAEDGHSGDLLEEPDAVAGRRQCGLLVADGVRVDAELAGIRGEVGLGHALDGRRAAGGLDALCRGRLDEADASV